MSNPFEPGYYSTAELRTLGFRSVGENVQVARNCTIIGLHNIAIGNNVRIDGYTTIVAERATCTIGDYIHIGGGCHLVAAAELALEDFSGLSQGVRIYTASDDYTGLHLTNPTVPAKYLGVKVAPIRLGRHVIVGSGTVILPGASIGEGSSVGALALVTKPLEPWGIYAGNPAKRIRARSQRLLALEAELLQARQAAVAAEPVERARLRL